MSKIKLDQEEQDLLASFEADEFESDLTEKRKAFLSNVAGEASKKDKRINIRISSRDLTHLLIHKSFTSQVISNLNASYTIKYSRIPNPDTLGARFTISFSA